MNDILKIALLLGYIEKDVIVEWADELISNGDISEEIIDLSLSRDKSINEIIRLLNTRSNNTSKDAAKNFFLNYFRKRFHPVSAVLANIESELLKFYYLNEFEFSEDEKFTFSALASDYSLRKDGYLGHVDVKNEMNVLLEKYKNFDYSKFKADEQKMLKRLFNEIMAVGL